MSELTLVGSPAHALRRLEEAGPRLREASEERLVSSLLGAVARLRDGSSPIGRELRLRARESSGLSEACVEQGLEGTLGIINETNLKRFLWGLRDQPGLICPARLSMIVLAGNVFTAGLRPSLISLLCRAPTVLKPKSGGGALARGLAAALRESDPELAEAFAVLEASREERERLSPILSRVDVLSVYGSDRSVAELRALAPPTATFVPHGHGLGVAWLSANSVDMDTIAVALEGLALDLIAYDQRGCLSPHALYVEEGGPLSVGEVAEHLRARLSALSGRLPRGLMPLVAAASQMQWRAVAEVRGDLLEGPGFALAIEPGGGFRPSPGYRNLGICPVPDRQAFLRSIAPLGSHLKALGVAGGATERAALAASLPPGLVPRISAFGEMQRPPLDALADGQPPWLGFVRFMKFE